MERLTTIILFALTALLVAAGSAFAHVTANPSEQPADGFGKVTFRVPNERDVPTTKVTIQIPDGINSISVQSTPGWTYEVKMRKLDEPVEGEHGGEQVTEVPSEVAWSGGQVKPGEFAEFSISTKFPAKGEVGDQVFFPAIQEYQGGEEVSWIEKPASADDEESLESPAPSVTLGEGGGQDDAEASVDDDDGDSGSTSNEDRDDAIDTLANYMRLALLTALLALLVGLYNFLRMRRKP